MSDNINPNPQTQTGKIGETMIQKYPKLYELFTEYVGKAKASPLRFEAFMDDYTDEDEFINEDDRSVLEKHHNSEEAVASIEKFIVYTFIEADVIGSPYYRPFGDNECEELYGWHLLTTDFTPAFIAFFTEKFEERADFRDFLESHKLVLFGHGGCPEYDIIDKLDEGAEAFLDWHGIYATQHTPLWSNLDCFWSLLGDFEEWKQNLYQEKACGCLLNAQDCYCGDNPLTMAELCAEASVGETDIICEPGRISSRTENKKEIKLFPWDDSDIPF